VLAVAGIARRLENLFGGPQDIEWAAAGGEIFVLQARPITALPDPAMPEAEDRPAVDVPPGFWERDASHFPVPLTPMMRSLATDRQNAAFREASKSTGPWPTAWSSARSGAGCTHESFRREAWSGHPCPRR
jgi:pyruvate,water dikinase